MLNIPIAIALSSSAFALTVFAEPIFRDRQAQSSCRVAGEVIRIRELPEGSGVAASRRTPGVFWAHNDSGSPVLFALNEKGVVSGRVRVTGAEVDDWEDIAVGPCGEATCLYIADIGDNSGRRERITLYRVPEPAPADASTRPAEVFHARYPDGPRDAESLFVTANSDVFIITKGDPGPVALYRFPRPLRSGSPMQLERVGNPAGGAKVDDEDRPTAADLSADGRWVAVRTTHRVAFHRAADLTAGRWQETFRADLRSLKEPRGEGIAFGANGALILVGEGGLSGPGTFARVVCTMPE
jgi:hypothetical protein